MTSRFEIQTVLGIDYPVYQLPDIFIGTTALDTIRIKNVGDSAPTVLRLTIANFDFTFSGKQNFEGQEIVTRKFVQAKIGAGSWTPIGGDFGVIGNCLGLPLLAPDAYQDVDLRLVVPSDAVTKGAVRFTVCGAKSDV